MTPEEKTTINWYVHNRSYAKIYAKGYKAGLRKKTKAIDIALKTQREQLQGHYNKLLEVGLQAQKKEIREWLEWKRKHLVLDNEREKIQGNKSGLNNRICELNKLINSLDKNTISNLLEYEKKKTEYLNKKKVAILRGEI